MRRSSEHGEGSSSPKRPRSANSVRCEKHNFPLQVYCCTDQKVICSMCAFGEHQGHNTASVEDVREIQQVNLKETHAQFSQMIQKHENNQEDKKMLNKVKEHAREAEDSSEGAIVEVIDSLQRHLRSVRELIRNEEKAAVTQVTQFLLAKLKEMKSRETELNCLAETKCDVCFLQQWSSLRSRCEEDLKQGFPEVPQDLLLPFKKIKDAVRKLSEQVKEFHEKEFAILSQSGEVNDTDNLFPQVSSTACTSFGDLPAVPNCPTEQDVEPTTRDEFLQYACELSLDPATANADLIVSGGDKVVKHQKATGPATSNLERFTHRRQVMCREGLQDERCYYEVKVNGKKAEVALAYKGIKRKSTTPQSALGANEMSWSLDISNTYSVSHNSDSVQLTEHPTRYPKIGVYLQFKKGILTFYEVADEMKFLYRVEAKFSKPLYPVFWLDDECRITICDLTPQRSFTIE